MPTITTRPPSATLSQLLDRELDFSPSFRVIYSSHLAMALVGLDQMGASPERLEEVLRRHASSGAEARDDKEDLQERIAEVRRYGIEATVRRRLPHLADAPGTALFHPAIRLAYGLDAGHEGQVAAALLDWEKRRHVLPTPERQPGRRRLPDVAVSLSSHGPGTWPSTFDLDGISRRPELAEALAGVTFDGDTLDDVSRFALMSHVTADDFVTLHLVTGARAVRRIAELLDPETADRLAAASLEVAAVGYAAVGAPPLLGEEQLDEIRHATLPDRADIEARAVADDDPHVIKLANVALVEEVRTGEPLYRFIAARVVGLISAR